MSLIRLSRARLLAASIALSAAGIAAPAAWAQDPASAPVDVAASDAMPAADAAPATPIADTAAGPSTIEAPTAEKVEIDNPYGLEQIIKHGDIVDQIVLVILAIMSIGSWYIMFTKVWEQSKLLRSAREVSENFWASGSLRKGAEALPETNAFRYIADQGLKASEHHEGTLVENIDKHTWIGMSVQRASDLINSRLQGGLAFLATVGSTAPFVGLFGTVWGILNALTTIGLSGQASIDKVAGPVGSALIMTAIGLAVAVPAVMGYNWLIRRNKLVMEKVGIFAGDVHNVLLSGRA